MLFQFDYLKWRCFKSLVSETKILKWIKLIQRFYLFVLTLNTDNKELTFMNTANQGRLSLFVFQVKYFYAILKKVI